MSRKGRKGDDDIEPTFTRSEVAKILDVTVATVANREKSGEYPKATRSRSNNYRTYSLNDVLNLQVLTYGIIDTRRVLSVMYDKGYRDTKQIGLLMEAALARRRGIVS